MNKLRHMIHSSGHGRWEDIGARTLTHFLDTLESGVRHRIWARSIEDASDIVGIYVEPGKAPRQVGLPDDRWREEWLSQK